MDATYDLENETIANNCYRRVIFTGKHLQLVLMALKKRQIIETEIHESVDQFFRVEEGHIEVNIEGEIHHVLSGQSIIIPAGMEHEVTAIENTKLYTIYAPPNHHPNRRQC